MSQDDELLRPTVQPWLNAGRFRSLWNPTSLIYGAFFGSIFGGAVAGGLLFGINFKRMGRTTLAGVAMALGVGLNVVAAFASSASSHTASGESERLIDRTDARIGLMVVTAILALAAARSQAPAFRAFRVADGTPRNSFGPAVLAGVIGFAFEVAVEFFLMYRPGAYR